MVACGRTVSTTELESVAGRMPSHVADTVSITYRSLPVVLTGATYSGFQMSADGMKAPPAPASSHENEAAVWRHLVSDQAAVSEAVPPEST